MKVTRRTTLTLDITEEEYEIITTALTHLFQGQGDTRAGLLLQAMTGAPFVCAATPTKPYTKLPDLAGAPSVIDTNSPPAGHTPESFAALPPMDQIRLLAAQTAEVQRQASTPKPVVVDEEARQEAAKQMGVWGAGAGDLPTQLEDDEGDGK